MRGVDCGGKTLSISFILFVRRSSPAPCSPSRDKQLTFGMTHSTLISAKYSTVPLFKAVNLISEGSSHLAITFWTIKPISEEQGLSGGLYSTNYVEPFDSMSNILLKWAIVAGEPYTDAVFKVHFILIYTLRYRLYSFTKVRSSGTTVISSFSRSSKKNSGFVKNLGFVSVISYDTIMHSFIQYVCRICFTIYPNMWPKVKSAADMLFPNTPKEEPCVYNWATAYRQQPNVWSAIIISSIVICFPKTQAHKTPSQYIWTLRVVSFLSDFKCIWWQWVSH